MSDDLVPIEVFCSYAPEDEIWLRKLETHLSLLKRQGLIATWHNRLVLPGTNREQDIDSHLNSASLVLLLVSSDFLASDYCYGIEMQRALQRHKAGQARVIPLVMRPADWKGAPFAHLQSLPHGGKAVTTWNNQDEAFLSIVEGIRLLTKHRLRRSSSTRGQQNYTRLPKTKSTSANLLQPRSVQIRAEQHPQKGLAILDRRIATELITFFSRPDESRPLEPQMLQVFQAALGLFEQLLVESIYSSSLASIINHEDLLRQAITFIGKIEEQEEEEFTTIVEEDAETRAKDLQFQVVISQYEKSKGISTANASENMAYLRHTLLLARLLNAVIIPHPDRWPLYHWLFEHCIFGEEGTTDATITLLPKDLIHPVLKIPQERAKRVATFSARWSQQRDIPIAIYRYGPMTYPFSKTLLRNYDQEDLASFEPFVYEFCAPAPVSSDQEGRVI